MKRVTYTVSEGIVVLNTFSMILRFAGLAWPYQRWAVSADVFDNLKAQNPDVEFVKGD